MASRSTRKTWETAFLLSASMSSSYQETFDKAQNILQELGAENVKLGDEAERWAQRQENAFQLATAAIAEAGLTEALDKVKDAYVDIIEVTMEFESTVSAVEALSEASAEEVGKLEEKARRLGETTVFTAQQSAEAMTFMAQAGWDTVEMLEGMDGVISLAAASGTDLAETSSIVADTLAGFGMEASETGWMADVLAQTASHTNTNVSLMGQTFQNAAAIAGALGFKIEDVSVMLGIMANAGVKGSRAGTSLRNIFNGLAKDATLTAEAFGEVDFSMFDENGKSKDLISVVRELRTYFDQMTEREKYLNAEGIAGLRGYNALLAIINATDEQFEELYADIQNADGAAKRMADTRLDNLKGDVTLLKSAFESLKITIGEELTPAGRDLVDWMTEVTANISQFIKDNPQVVTNITSITAGIAGGAAALTTVFGILKAISAIKLVASVLTGGPAIVAAIGAITAALGTYIWMLAREKSVVGELIEEHDRITQEYADATGALDEQYGSIQNYLTILGELSSKEQRSESDKQKLLAVVKKLNEAVPELGLEYDEYTDKLNMSAEAVKNLARAEYLRKMQTERMQKMEELAGLSVEQESAAMDLKADIGEKNIRQEEIEAELAGLRENRTTWDYLNPFSDYSKQEKRLVEERATLAMEITGLSNNLRKLEGEQRNTEAEYNALADEYVREQSQFNYWWDRATEQTPEIDRGGPEEPEPDDLEAEKAGREQIEEAEKANADAGFDMQLSAADMRNAENGTWVSSADTSGQYDGYTDIPDTWITSAGQSPDEPAEPEGAVVTMNGGDVNITMNVNVAGNVAEDSMPEMERVVGEAADRVIEFIRRDGRNRTRLGYNQ